MPADDRQEDYQLGARVMARCCGERREPGGIYVESGGGVMPPEDMLMCPPKRIGLNNILPALGMKIFYISGSSTPHIADMIGMNSYPSPVMWFEEVRMGGVSRRIPEMLARVLEPESMYFAAHKKAYVHNFDKYPHHLPCPKGKAEHVNLDALENECCTSFFWEDLKTDSENIERVGFPEDAERIRIGRERYTQEQVDEAHLLKVTLPAGEFYAYRRTGVKKPEYSKYGAFFACFSISRLVVIDDPVGGSHTEKLRSLRSSTRLIVDQVQR